MRRSFAGLAWICAASLFVCVRASFAGPDGDTATEASYQAARTCYYGVQSDAKKVRDRGAWESCAQAFLTLAKAAPKSSRGADAAYTVGRLYEQLFSLSKNTEDLRTAQDHYIRFAKQYRKYRLTDDALLRAGIIAWEGFHKRKEAERLWWQVEHWTKDGDQVKTARGFLAQIATLKKDEFRSLAPLLTLSAGGGISAAPSAAHETHGGAKADAKIATTVTTTTATAAATGAAQQAATLTLPHAANATANAATAGAAAGAANNQATSATSTNVANNPSASSSATPPQSLHIVIDAGHGGKDPGAQGPHGTQEKDVTLALARKLADALHAKLNCTTTLTRSSDRFVSLGERNTIANKRHADLFISIHANAAPNADAHGMQTYFLNNASDEAARRLASRENASVAGTTSDVAGTELEHIMSTMLQNAYTEESRDLADAVQHESVKTLKTKYAHVNDQGVHSALFYVLVGAKSPAILIETAFISNPEEELRLRDAQYQTSLITGVVTAVEHYLKANPKRATL